MHVAIQVASDRKTGAWKLEKGTGTRDERQVRIYPMQVRMLNIELQVKWLTVK